MKKANATITVCYYDLDLPKSEETNLIASMDSNYIPSVDETISISLSYDKGHSEDYKVINVCYDLDCFSADGLDKDAKLSSEMVMVEVRKLISKKSKSKK